MKIKIFVLLIISIISISACKVTFVPNNDAAIEQQITDAAKENDKLYLELLAASKDKRSYQDYEKEYVQIEVEINSINLKNEARKNNKEMLDIITKLHQHFTKYRNEHKERANNLFTDAMIMDYENDMAAFWKALYFAEKNLPLTTPK